MRRRGESYYETAQICLNGHVITPYYDRSPEQRQKHCDRCGAKAVHQCPHCHESIRGKCIIPGITFVGSFEPSAFCHNCGQAFPWTEIRLEAARQLVHELEELDEEDKAILEQSIDELVKDSPMTPLAARTFKKIMTKAGKGAAAALREILFDVVSEPAKKTMWPQ